MAFAAVALVATVVAAGITAYGEIEQGQAQAQAAKYQAEVARNNARYASEAGQAQAMAVSERNAQTMGRIGAAQAANGIDPDTGSAVKVREGAREVGNVDAQNTENNALLQAYGYQAQGKLDTMEASDDEEAGYLKAGGTLVGAASSVAGGWNNAFGDSSSSAASGGVPDGPV